MKVVRRTFEALQHPKGSAERAALNLDWLTSEYMPSHRYGVRGDNGEKLPRTFRTKAEAAAHAFALDQDDVACKPSGGFSDSFLLEMLDDLDLDKSFGPQTRLALRQIQRRVRLSRRLLAVLERIRDFPACENSNPDVMADALITIKAEASAGIARAMVGHTDVAQPKERLEYLRGELQAERISLDEIHELQSLAAFIDPSDVELLEAAGVPEESQHTPEGWRLGVPEDNPANGIRIVDCQDVTIATVWRQPSDPPEWAEGNAKLIVAAPAGPELLAALRRLVENNQYDAWDAAGNLLARLKMEGEG